VSLSLLISQCAEPNTWPVPHRNPIKIDRQKKSESPGKVGKPKQGFLAATSNPG
jgi:hypothetical protein